MDRLVRSLEDVGTIKESRKKLETLQEDIAKAKGELKAIRDTVTKAIDEVKTYATDQITKRIEDNAGNNISKADKVCRKALSQIESV